MKRGTDESVGDLGRGPSRWPAVVVALVTFAAMARLCGADFTWWDDPATLHHNPLMNPPTWATVVHYWTRPFMGLYVPVTYTVWAGLAAIGRVDVPDERGIALNSYLFHSANVIVHVANALIVYAILRRVVRKEWAAAVGAMVFGVHPVQVEAVGWVSGMKDLLCGSCVLGAVWAYLVYAAGTAASRARGAYWATVVLSLAGTLCKPTAVVTPLLLLAVGRWALGRSWRELAGELWPVVLVVLPCVVWARAVQHVAAKGPAWERPLVGLDAIAFYVVKLLWPAALGVDYGRTPGRILETGAAWWTWVVPAGLGLLVAVRGRRWPAVVAGAGVFVGGLVPVLGLVPFMFQEYSTTADHYLYLPMLGVAMAAAWAVTRWPGRWMAAIAGVVLVALSVRTVVQAGVWQDEDSLDANTLAVNPRSSLGHLNAGVQLEHRAEAEHSEALRDAAVAHLREAVRLNPGNVTALQNLSAIMTVRGRVDEAIALLQQAIRVADERPAEEREQLGPSYRVLGMVLARRGRYAEAAEMYRKALEYQPDDAGLRAELADLERTAATRPTSRP